MSFYKEKLDSILQKEVAAAILREIDKKDFLITITKVKTDSDSLESNVFLKVFPESKENEALKELEENKIAIQKLLNKRIKIKHVPKIKFKIDKETK